MVRVIRNNYKLKRPGISNEWARTKDRHIKFILSPSKRHRFRNRKVSLIPHRSDYIAPGGQVLNARQSIMSEHAKYWIRSGMRRTLKKLVCAYVLKNTSNSQLGERYLNSLPFNKLHIENPEILSSLPLWLDLEADKTQLMYVSEVVDCKEIFGELRAYDYLVEATQRFINDLWIATYNDAKQSMNTKPNLFTYFGFHNLFTRRAAKLIEEFRANPFGMVRKFSYGTLVKTERRYKYIEKGLPADVTPETKRAVFTTFASYDEKRINLINNCYTDYGNVYKYAHGISERIIQYLYNLEFLRDTSVLFDYRVPLIYDLAKLTSTSMNPATDYESTIALMMSYAPENPVNAKHFNGQHSYVCGLLSHGISSKFLGSKLDFTKANKKSLLLADDLIGGSEYLPEYSYPFGYDDDSVFNTFKLFPITVQAVSYTTSSDSCVAKKLPMITDDIGIALKPISSYENDRMSIQEIGPNSCILYPPIFKYAYKNADELNARGSRKEIQELPDWGMNSTPALKITSSYNEDLGGRLSVIRSVQSYWGYERKRTMHNPCTLVLTTNAQVLQSISMILVAYLEWVNKNIDISTLDYKSVKLLDRAKMLVQLTAKHGNPEYVLNILDTIVSRLKPLPNNDF